MRATAHTPTQREQEEPETEKGAKTRKRAKTLTALADAVGLSYRTLLDWKRKDGFPKPTKTGYDVEGVRVFIAANRKNNHGGKLGEEPASSVADEERTQKIRKLKAEADLRELKVQEMRGVLVNAREIAEAHTKEIEIFRRNIFRLLVELPPRLANITDPSIIEEELRTAINDIFGEMARGYGDDE